MKARCKFRVMSVTDTGYNKIIKLAAQYDPSLPEDQKFSKAIPSGSMEFFVDNPAVDGLFTPGRDFYIDLIPADSER